MKICPLCKRIYNQPNDYYCLNDRNRLVPYSDEQSEQDQLERREQIVKQSNIPICPTCKSTNIKTISYAKRVLHGYAFGLFSKTARSQFECQNCGYKW
jgi:hypothetical protein